MLLVAFACLSWNGGCGPSLPSRTVRWCRGTTVIASQPLELKAIDLQRKLGEGSFAEMTASKDAEKVLSGRALTSISAARVQVGLFYGEVRGGEGAGTRVLVKAYSPSDQPPPWAEEASKGDDVRAQLEAALTASGDGSSAAAQSLEASLTTSKSGASLAEALALNEFAAHSRVQRMCADPEQCGLARLLGRLSESDEDGVPVILHAFRTPAVLDL